MIDAEQTHKTADLIKIDIKKSEENAYTAALVHALDPAKSFAELDTDGVGVLSHPTGLTTSGFTDQVKTGLTQQEALANAGDERSMMGYFVVKQVIKN